MPRLAKPEKGVFERVPGSGNWYARIIHDGQRVVKSFGTDRQAAMEYLKDMRAKKRLAPGDIRLQIKRNRTTVGELCDTWLAKALADPERKDKINPPAHVRTIKARFGNVVASELRRPDVRDWLDSMNHLKPATTNKLKAAFPSVYRLAIENEVVESNPIRDVKSRKMRTSIVRYLKQDEEKRIREVLQQDIAAAEARHGEKFTDYRTSVTGKRSLRTRERDCSVQIKRLKHRIYELDFSPRYRIP